MDPLVGRFWFSSEMIHTKCFGLVMSCIDLFIISFSLQCNSTLLSLRLSGNKIGNRGAMHLASMLQVNDALKELELDACDLVNTHKHTQTHSVSGWHHF